MFPFCSYSDTPASRRPQAPANALLPRQVGVSADGNQLRGRVMVYRKGELSKGTIDREWPHQVALPAARCLGHSYETIRLFCEDHRLSLRTRGHSFRRDDTGINVFCFAERPHAEQFQARFGGEFIDPKSRPKSPGGRKRV